MGTILQDLKYASRMLVKNPGFTAVAVITLALGIGANSAIFSVVNGVLLQPLPYRDPGRLVAVGESVPQFQMMSFSFPNLRDFREQSRSFDGLAGFNWVECNLTGMGEPEHLSGKRVTADFFPVLGINPVLGRNFDASEDRAGASPVAMISEGLWKRRFGSSPDAISKSITLNGKGYTVVGVVPASFEYRGKADVYTLLGQWDDMMARLREVHPGIHAVARLKPGVTVARAQSEMSTIAAQLAQTYPKSNANHGATVRPLAQEMVGNVKPALLVLLGAVGFVLLIACANVANLLLARSTSRQREMAIRAALGAGRSRVIRQLLTESVLLAITGGALGLLVASWGTQFILATTPGGLPRMENIGVDGWVLAFTLLVSLFTGVLFGMAPAFQISRIDLTTTLKEGGRGTSAGHHRLRSVLVVAETGASLVLLVGAGLMLRTMGRLSQVDPGFDPRHLLMFSVGLSPDNSSTPDKIRLAYKKLTDGMESLPGAQGVTIGNNIPLAGDDNEIPLWVSGRPRPATQSDMAWAQMYVTGPGYLKAMGIPLLKGRYFADGDTKDSQGVVVIDDVMAQGLFPGQDPIGKSVAIADLSGNMGNGLNQPLEIVGVVGHVKHWGLDSDDTAKIRYEIYFPFVQIPDQLTAGLTQGMTLLVRTSVDPLSMVPAVKQRVTQAGGGDEPTYDFQTMQQVVSQSFADRRFSMLLLGVFAALALVLAAVGIYGVISYTANQRTHEIGIRMALGASSGHVLKLIVGQGLTLVVAGIGVGLLAAFGLTRLMAGMLYGVRPTDLVTFAAVPFVLAAVALVACYIPARRAAKVDPMVALRYE
ncbi:MAG TPA: ABC transporter permease [Terriglobia bacterium]|nr:ABC transporter permease [Terriglobia bacterium]